MKIYKEIIDFLQSNMVHQGHSLINRPRKRNLSDVLFEKISNGEFKNEEEAALEIYGTWDYRFRRLRGRFIDNITTSILGIDFKGQQTYKYSKNYYACLREITVAKILNGKTFYSSAVFFAKRCYDKSRQYGYYDLLFDSIRILKAHYGTRLMMMKKYSSLKNELEEVREILRLEDLAASHYADMIIHQKRNRHKIVGNVVLYQEYFDELKPYLQSCNSFRFQLFTRTIRLNIYSIQHDFEKMLKYAKADLDFYMSHSIFHPIHTTIFLTQKITACVRLGIYEEGLKDISTALDIIGEKNVNWFPLKYKQFFIYMQSKRYAEAQRIYHEVINHKRYKTLFPAMKEDWKVGGAYLNYVIESGLLETKQEFKFRLGKFLNSVPEYSKDRRVKNIPILIAQILFMIKRGQTNKAIDRIESIQMYCYGNLRYNEAVRSNAFIRMLLEIPKRSFKKQPVLDRVGKYLKKLKEVPLHQSGKNFDLELIPYERLWEYVVSNLK
ncbi:MAG: hypothetical protein AAGG68_25905 [Bacteroidota bacterium]